MARSRHRGVNALTRLTLGFLIAGIAAAAAVAQPAREPSPPIEGQWTFETGVFGAGSDHRGGCRITGVMTLSRASSGDGYTCSFLAQERCGGGMSVNAEQSCTAKRTGALLEISSAVVRVSPQTISYAPDNWSLTIRAGDVMVGQLRSADVASAIFRRRPAMIS